MNERGNLENRVSRLEQQGSETDRRLETALGNSSAARMLAAGADHDVSEVRAELRAHRSALNALQEGQSELRQEMRAGFDQMYAGFDQMYAGFDEVRIKFALVDAGFDEIRGKFAVVNAGLQHIVTLIDERSEDGS